MKQLGDQFHDETKQLDQWLLLGLDCMMLKNVDIRISSKELHVPKTLTKKDYLSPGQEIIRMMGLQWSNHCD